MKELIIDLPNEIAVDYVSLIDVILNRGDSFHPFLTHLFFKKNIPQ